MVLNNSPARWFEPPLPDEPKFSAPGLALATAINSFMFFAGTPGCTTTTSGVVLISVIGSKSFNGSYGSFFIRLGTMVNGAGVTNSV